MRMPTRFLFRSGIPALILVLRALECAGQEGPTPPMPIAPPVALVSGVRDGAGMFDPEAVRRAEEALQRIEARSGLQIVIETVESAGDPSRQQALADEGASRIRGLYILIALRNHRYQIQPSPSAKSAFGGDRRDLIARAIGERFGAGELDQGLLDAVAQIEAIAATASDVATPMPVAPPATRSSGVRDDAGMFGPEAVCLAGEALRQLEARSGIQVLIETVDALGGDTIEARSLANAQSSGTRGLYVLMAKREHKLYLRVHRSAEWAFPAGTRREIEKSFVEHFRSGQFDWGLVAGVALIERMASGDATRSGPTPAPAGPSPGGPPPPQGDGSSNGLLPPGNGLPPAPGGPSVPPTSPPE